MVFEKPLITDQICMLHFEHHNNYLGYFKLYMIRMYYFLIQPSHKGEGQGHTIFKPDIGKKIPSAFFFLVENMIFINMVMVKDN